jgi:hypothetical protein
MDRRRFRFADVIRPDQIAVCGTIIQEVLQGARSGTLHDTQETLVHTHLVDLPLPLNRFEYAAEITAVCACAASRFVHRTIV